MKAFLSSGERYLPGENGQTWNEIDAIDEAKRILALNESGLHVHELAFDQVFHVSLSTVSPEHSALAEALENFVKD